MKKHLQKFLLAFSLCALMALLLPCTALAQSQETLEECVDLVHLETYLTTELRKYDQETYTHRVEIPLSSFQIPADLQSELLQFIEMNVPDIILTVDYTLDISADGYVHKMVLFNSTDAAQTRDAADALLRGIEGNDALTDLEIALLLHDRLILWTERSSSSENASRPYGALVDRMCNREGYAKAYQYLLARAGVYSEIHTLTQAGLQQHWNAVWIDGVSYMVDVAYDDLGGYAPAGLSQIPISHQYFLRISNRYELADQVGIEPYGKAYNDVHWPERTYLIDNQVYGEIDSAIYLLEGTETTKVKPTETDSVSVNGSTVEIGDALYCCANGLYSSDVTTGQLNCVWGSGKHITRLEYRNGRVACLINDEWVEPFADTAYTVTFQNPDGSVLQSGVYQYGEIVKAPEGLTQNGYSFTGWDKLVIPCTGDTVYTAQFSPCKLPNGWVKENDRWYYIQDDCKKTGWINDGGNWYYLDYAGIMQTGLYQHRVGPVYVLQTVTHYYFDENGVMQTGWQQIEKDWYYFSSSGQAVTGWQFIDGRWFFFENNCKMRTGWREIDGITYFFDVNLGMIVGWHQLISETGSLWIYCAPNGNKACGWQLIGGLYYYFDSYGYMQTGWLTTNNVRYYLCDNGAMATGWQKIENNWYYFSSSGEMLVGWLQINGNWYYLGSKNAFPGIMHQNTTSKIGEDLYRFDENGVMLTGWFSTTLGWQYYGSTGAMVYGWQLIGESWYYFDVYGIMSTGHRKIDGIKYYFGTDGAMRTGWIAVPVIYYKLDGSVEYGIQWNYADASGAMVTGWQWIDGTWYYFTNSNTMVTGWQQIGGTWYYFADSGAMVTGWLYLNGTWYYMLDSGAMATNISISGGYIDSSGIWHG